MSNPYDTSEKFCLTVGTANLVSYLALTVNATASEALESLAVKKAYLASVQDLPEYRKEAASFSRAYEAFQELLNDPADYVREIARRKVFKHLPELRKNISELMNAGPLNIDSVSYLRRSALDLGVTMDIFDEALNEMCELRGIVRPTEDVITFAAPVGDFRSSNPYKILGTSRHANLEGLKASYSVNLAAARNIGDAAQSLQALAKVEHAWKTLSNSETREIVDAELFTAGATEPTAPIRTVRKLEPRKIKEKKQHQTDPLRFRTRSTRSVAPKPNSASIGVLATASRAGNIEIQKSHEGSITVVNQKATVTLTIVKKDKNPLYANVSTDCGWLFASPATLHETAETQEIQVQIDPASIFDSRVTGRVVLQLETGEKIFTPISVEKVSWWSPMANIPAFAGTLALISIALFLTTQIRLPSGSAEALNIRIDPSAEIILINGDKVGSGSFHHIPRPEIGNYRLQVIQANFQEYTNEFKLEEGEIRNEIVRLRLKNQMDFRPTAGMKRDTSIQVKQIEKILPVDDLQKCATSNSKSNSTEESKLLIYLGRNGHAQGVEIDGPLSGNPKVTDCLTRRAATVRTDSLTDGDYAVIGVYLSDSQ